MSVDRLSIGDLMMLWSDEPATPMHIGLAGILDGRPGIDAVRASVQAALDRAPSLTELLLGGFAKLDQLLLPGEHRRLSQGLGFAFGFLDEALRDFVGGGLGGALAFELGPLPDGRARPSSDKEKSRQGEDEGAEHGKENHLVHSGSMLHRASAGEGKPPLGPRSAPGRAALEIAPT